jgi:hypothetical protein
VTLVVICDCRSGSASCGAARTGPRVVCFRDKIKQHDIQFAGTGLDLGDHDQRDVVKSGCGRGLTV